MKMEYFVVFCIRLLSFSIRVLRSIHVLVCISSCSFLAEHTSLYGCAFFYLFTSWFIILGHILKDFPNVCENNVYSTVIVRSALYISIQSIWLIVLSQPSISLLIFHPIVLSLTEMTINDIIDIMTFPIGIGNSPTLIIRLSALIFLLLIFWGCLVKSVYVINCYGFLMYSTFIIIKCSSLLQYFIS